MDLRKILCTALAVCTVVCCTAGCGGTDSSDNEPAASTAGESTVDVAAVADKLKNSIAFEDELTELEGDKIGKIVGVLDEKYTAAKVYVSATGGTPEEIDCFEAKDETAAADIKAALETRIESQKKTFTDYRPEQAPKINDPVLKVNGRYVYLCVSGDNAKAEEIIG